jgi:transcription termination factor Rho
VNDTNAPQDENTSLTAKKLPELQQIAVALGVKGVRRLRKSDLIEAISTTRAGGTPRTAEKASEVKDTKETTPATTQDQGHDDRPRKNTQAAASNDPSLDLGIELPEGHADTSRGERASRGERGQGERRSRGDRGGQNDRGDQKGRGERNDRDDGDRHSGGDRQNGEDRQNGNDRQKGQDRQKGENRKNGNDRQNGQDRQNGNDRQNGADRHNGGDRDRREGGDRRRQDREGGRGDQSSRPTRIEDIALPDRSGERRDDRRHDGEDDDRRSRNRSRNRSRDRKRKGQGRGNGDGGQDNYEDTEVREGDELVSVAGILDIRDNNAYVRTTGYLPGSSDVYVSMNQVRKNGLRKGDAITGQVRALREGEERQQQYQNQGGGRGRRGRNNNQGKFAPLVQVDTVNGMTSDRARSRVEFNKLTPLYPQDRLRLETTGSQIATRLIDLVSPIGKGQRGLIVSPAKAGKTTIMQQIANAITANNPEVHLMVVLVDERPEEVTDMERTVKGEVISSTFDRPASDHAIVAELAIERAKRLVEMGRDVVVLLDGITRLSRAYNLAAPASGRILSGGVDASALYPPKRFFGAARNIEHGGSLTILASALVESGSKMDEVIFEEFKGTGNMELRLNRALADRRIFPAVDVNSSSTRREELLLSKEELAIMWKLRRVLGALEPQQAIDVLLERLKKTQSNAEFLMTVAKNTPSVGGRQND